MDERPRIYADFNNMIEDDLVSLSCVGSEKSIRELTGRVRAGLLVLLSDGELEVEATIVRDCRGSWAARPDWKTRKDL